MLERVITRRRGRQRPSDPNEARRGAVKACAADTQIEEEVHGGRKSCRPLSISSTGASTKWATRVKNDLQTLSALTILKARRTEDERRPARALRHGGADRRPVDGVPAGRLRTMSAWTRARSLKRSPPISSRRRGQPTAVALELGQARFRPRRLRRALLVQRADRECASARWVRTAARAVSPSRRIARATPTASSSRSTAAEGVTPLLRAAFGRRLSEMLSCGKTQTPAHARWCCSGRYEVSLTFL